MHGCVYAWWELMTPKPACSHPAFYRECLEAFNDYLLEKIVTLPTRGKNILDLFLTFKPYPHRQGNCSPWSFWPIHCPGRSKCQAKNNQAGSTWHLTIQKGWLGPVKTVHEGLPWGACMGVCMHNWELIKYFCLNSLLQTFRFCGTSSSLNSSKTSTHLSRLVRPDHEMVSPWINQEIRRP